MGVYDMTIFTQATVEMSILKCLKRSSDLPDTEGPFSKEMESYTIRFANEKVKPENDKSQRYEMGHILDYNAITKGFDRERAAEHRVTATIHHFSGR